MARRRLDGEMAVLLLDSITEIRPEDAGCVVVSGSHGGLSAASYAVPVPLAICFFNDAGIGKDDAGIAGLASLDYPAAAYSHLSARIGDPLDGWSNGLVTSVNGPAQKAGISAGMTVAEAALRLRP